jgi:hypothetical protein
MEPLTSSRGFDYFEPFKTSYGHELRVYESSAVNPSLWLRIDAKNNTCGDYPGETSVHLRLHEAKLLRDQLSWLIDHHYNCD